jgi:hypothetical protein
MRLISGFKDQDKEKRPKSKLFLLQVWWAVYTVVTKRKGKQSVYALQLGANDTVQNNPNSADDWEKLLKAVKPKMKGESLQRLLGKGESRAVNDPPAPADSWKALLQPQPSALAGVMPWFTSRCELCPPFFILYMRCPSKCSSHV